MFKAGSLRMAIKSKHVGVKKQSTVVIMNLCILLVKLSVKFVVQSKNG